MFLDSIHGRYLLGAHLQKQPRIPVHLHWLVSLNYSCHGVPWCILNQIFRLKSRCFSFPFQICWNGLKSLIGVSRFFSRKVAELAALAHKPFFKKRRKFLTIEHCMYPAEQNGNFWQLCHLSWITWYVVFELNTHPFCLQALLKSSFSLAMSHLEYFIYHTKLLNV